MLSLIISLPINADPAWYFGTIDRVWTYSQDGGFIITYKGSSSISDCAYGYAYFSSKTMSKDLIKSSMTMALSAFHSDSSVGLVIDKKGANEVCHAMSIDLRK